MPTVGHVAEGWFILIFFVMNKGNTLIKALVFFVFLSSCSKDVIKEEVLVEEPMFSSSMSHSIERGDYTEGIHHTINVITGMLDDDSVSRSYSDVHDYVMNYMNENTTVPSGYSIIMEEYDLSFENLVNSKLVDSEFITSSHADLLVQFHSDITNISDMDVAGALAVFDNLLDQLEVDLEGIGLTQEQAEYFSFLLTSMQTGAHGAMQVTITIGGISGDCVGAALGAISLVAAIVTAPATGGLSVWAYVGAISTGLGTGYSIANCFPL